ncbi:hypothetical protein [Brucella gallinifaecis]|uniref:hypothetical protein n=1 Tax=Brucella gallinifaecis TaxID=215590 RepID=UPI002360CA38|nr:hypothetical protein [Brucella gallinifaecis]
MGVKTRILMTSVCLVFVTGISAAKEFPTGDPRGPRAVIETENGIGTSEANVVAKITKQSIDDWCDNWKPGDQSCSSDMASEVGTTFKATANCEIGTMTDTSGQKLKYAGRNAGEDFHNFYQFKNIETGNKIGFSNADGGQSLMAEWMFLCPYGLPYTILPLADKISVHDDKYNALRIDPDGYIQDYAYHNGKHMIIDYDLGTITYFEKQSATIPAERVLFRGSISRELGVPSRGVAYVFKKGCEAKPYNVLGYFDPQIGQLVLQGDAPVWKGCDISGYSSKSKNAKLVFDVMME